MTTPTSYSLPFDARFLQVTFDRWVTTAEAAAFKAELLAAGAWTSTRPVMIDTSRLTADGAPSFTEIHVRIATWATLVLPPPPIALLVSEGLSKGMADLTERVWGDQPCRVFTDEAAAIAWLHTQVR